MRRERQALLFATVAAALLCAPAAAAHPGEDAELRALDAALDAQPANVDLLLKRAAIHRRLNHLQASLADLAVIDHLAPGNRDMLLQRGLTRLAGGDPAGAEADLTRVLEGGPAAAAYVARGRIREAAGRLTEARGDYDAAARLRPEPEIVLARGHIDEVQGQLDRAAAGYEEGLKALGGAVAVRKALIRVETARGRHDRVVALADEAMKTAPVKTEWLLVRGAAHAAAGRAAQALRDRSAALAEIDALLKRRNTDFNRMTRAKALIALGRNAEAVRELTQIIARSPALTEAQTLLATARRAPRKP